MRYPVGVVATCLVVAASTVPVLGALSVLVMLIVVVYSMIRLGLAMLCRRRLSRSTCVVVSVRRVRVQHRMRSRGLFEVRTDDQIHHSPVFFHTGHLAVVPGATARMVRVGWWAAFDIEPGIIALPAGRSRRRRPSGTVIDAPRLNPDDLRSRSDRFGSVRRRAVLDAPAALGAPVIGLLWVLVAGGGAVPFLAATVLAATVAIWVSAIGGSDPS